MRKVLGYSSVALLLIFMLAGCGQKNETTAESSSDSLLASNPVEQPEGNIAPQTEYQTPEPEAEPEPVRQATTPRPKAQKPAHAPTTSRPAEPSGPEIAAGTPLQISVATQISSEHVAAGDAWTGQVKEAVIVGDQVVIPAGSTVHGIVEGSNPAARGDRAYLVLAVRSIDANGKSYSVAASTDSIIAGSTRARNLGAIAGGTAAGALIGKAVGGGGKGALIGGLVGGAVATGAVAKSKGFQVVIKEGTVITFNTDRKVTLTS